MHFNEIVESVIEKIAPRSKLTTEQMSKILMKTRASNKQDFSICLKGISSTAEEDSQRLYDSLVSDPVDIIHNVQYVNGNITFSLKKELFVRDILLLINREDCKFGHNNIGSGKKVVVDFSSPNIAKIFHVGHFRTTVLGNFVVNLLRVCGYETVSMNYLGDWGKQFGLVLLAYEKYRELLNLDEKLEKDPLVTLYELYVQINSDAKRDPSIDLQAKEILRKMEEDKEQKYLDLWKKFRALSIEKYKELYKKLNIEFDVYSGESVYNDKAKQFVQSTELAKRDEDGSYVIDCGEHGKALIQKSDGTMLYMTRDIASAIDRLETYKADQLIYVVADEQNKHFELLFACMEKLHYDGSLFRHINYGLIKGMSTRNGQVHFLEEVIERSARAVNENILSRPDKKVQLSNKEEVATNLAVSTLIVADFSAKRIKGYTFDIESRANCEKGSGAYLQYAHCRLKSIESVNSELDLSNVSDAAIQDVASNAIVAELVYKLIWLEHLIELSLVDFEPSRITLYLMDLARLANSLADSLKVKGVEQDTAVARLLVVRATRIVLNNALRILGIVPLDRM